MKSKIGVSKIDNSRSKAVPFFRPTIFNMWFSRLLCISQISWQKREIMKNAHGKILEASHISGSHKFCLYYIILAILAIIQLRKLANTLAGSPRRGNGFSKHDSVSPTVNPSGHKIPDSLTAPYIAQNQSLFKENKWRHSITVPNLKFKISRQSIWSCWVPNCLITYKPKDILSSFQISVCIIEKQGLNNHNKNYHLEKWRMEDNLKSLFQRNSKILQSKYC